MLTNEDKDCIKELAKEACCGSGEICQEFAQDAETAKNLAQQSAAQATIDAMTASVAASNALTSEQNALTSEQNALTSEQNAATSEQNALTSEQNALTSEQNALTSEQNALTSEQNAFTSEQNAQLAETNAVNAAATINSQVDFTGAGNGDILLHNGTLFEPVEHREALRDKVPFERSIVSARNENIIYWDSFIRPNATSLGVANSGQTYQIIQGSGNVAGIVNNNLYGISTNSIVAVDIAKLGNRNLNAEVNFRNAPPNTNSRSGILFSVDSDNYISLTLTRNEFFLESSINGVLTTVLNQSLALDGVFGGSIIDSIFNAKIKIWSRSTSLYIGLYIPELLISRRFDLSANASIFYDNINYFGYIIRDANTLRPFINSVILFEE
jgi:hypothetical protein